MIEGQTITRALDPHSFRGAFLDCFAQIENHVAPAIDRLVALSVAKKPPHLFGQKFDLISKNIGAEGVWRNRDHVGPIIEGLSSFASLRGLIAHGLIRPAHLGDTEAWSIEPPAATGWSERKVLTITECEDLIRSLLDLTKRLLKQKIHVVGPNPPSSPPPPSRGEAAGP